MEWLFEQMWVSIDEKNFQLPVFAKILSQTSPEVSTVSYPFSYISPSFYVPFCNHFANIWRQ